MVWCWNFKDLADVVCVLCVLFVFLSPRWILAGYSCWFVYVCEWFLPCLNDFCGCGALFGFESQYK